MGDKVKKKSTIIADRSKVMFWIYIVLSEMASLKPLSTNVVCWARYAKQIHLVINFNAQTIWQKMRHSLYIQTWLILIYLLQYFLNMNHSLPLASPV